MFLEQKKNSAALRGWIEVICGSMFSGKTEELIRRLKRARISKQRVEIFKPAIDKRYDEVNVVSHDSNFIPSTPIENSSQLLLMTENVDVIGIDEAQFFDEQLPQIVQELANKGSRIIIAGLDMDYLGKPFGPMPQLLAVAEYVTKVHAICMNCGELASYSHRTVKNSSRIMLGEIESYVPLCRSCFQKEIVKQD